MRLPRSSLLASRAGKLTLSLLLASPSLIPQSTAFTFTPVPAPDLDLAPLGRVAFAGDFDAISLYQYLGQNSTLSNGHSALLSRYPNGAFANIQNTDGIVKAMCPLVTDGQTRIVVGGTFTSVDHKNTPGGIALVNATDGSVESAPGLNGSVNALYCDSDRGYVFVGGLFDVAGERKNAMIFRADGNWSDTPFKGFNGAVQTIVKSPNQTIVFGGQFDGLNGVNATGRIQNNTQTLPVGSANITAQTSSGRPGFTDPQVIACKSDPNAQGSGSTWLLADNVPGFWKADFGFGFQPTRLRLRNTDFEGRGTKEFRYTALPDGGIMNLTYFDPGTGAEKFCDAKCPLPKGNTTAQDFYFVNSVGMNSFRIDILDWWGQGGGLNGIELSQTDIYSFAINEFNAPKCGGATTGASATATGPWLVTPSYNSNSEYLTATLDVNNYNSSSAFVVFQPDVPQSGNYVIKMYTPGCRGDGTCATRGSVNVTGLVASGAGPTSTIIAQTNDYDKYDEIFNGRVDVSNGFRPAVTLAPLPGQNTGNNFLTVVAQRVRFEINVVSGSDDLNGLFEYNPQQQTVDTDFSRSTIDVAGASLNPENAMINTLVSVNSKIYVGGNFTNNDGLNHIFAISNDGPTKLSGGGLNGQVSAMYEAGGTVYVGGNFTNTQDNGNGNLQRIAAYTNDQWQSLGGGVNGAVTSIVPISMNLTATPEDVIGISGSFDQVFGFGKSKPFSADNFAIWVPSKNNWLPNLPVQSIPILGSFTTFTNISNTERFYAGDVSSGALGASGAAVLKNTDPLALGSFPISIQAQQPQVSLRKRALTPGQNISATGITTATFYKSANMNKTILAGHFAVTGTDGQNITNVAIIDGNNNDTVTGFGNQVDSNSTFITLGVLDDILFAGGVVSGQIGNGRVGGIVAYDLSKNSFDVTQPPALQGTNVTVNAIAPRRNSKDVYVAGRFESAGQLSCPALCVWNTERSQWSSPGGDLSGVATSLFWVSETKAFIAGNLTVSNNRTKVFTYDSANSQYQEVAGANDLPGPVDALCPANREGSQIWAAGQDGNGAAFLQRFDGKKWLPVDNLFNPGTSIRGIQVLTLSDGQGHAKTDIIDQNQALLVLGQINITNFGIASAALYNGTTLAPFLLSTTTNGGPGSLSQVFVENPDFFRGGGKHLALGFVVLIALAIALALTFLLVVAGILIEWYRKRAQGYSPAPTSYTDRIGNVGRVPPEQLFGTLSGPRAPAI